MAELTLSIASLRKHHACDLAARVADLRRVLPDVTEDQPVPLRVWWDLPSTSVPDRWWSLRVVEPALSAQILGVRVACLAARRALPLTGEQDRAVCLTAIEAAEAWAAEPTEERRVAAPAAAYAADAASYAAYAASYAAYAATSAAYAADAASYAAYAASYAAYAATSASAAYAAASASASASAEREAQRTDLDRLLAEVSNG